MTKFPNPFELLEKKKNLEDMQNINDAKNIGNTAKDKAPGIATDLAGDVQDEVISAGQQVKNSKYVDYIYPTIIAILLFVLNSICYSNIFSKYQKDLNEKIIGEVENDSFWILKNVEYIFYYAYKQLFVLKLKQCSY